MMPYPKLKKICGLVARHNLLLLSAGKNQVKQRTIEYINRERTRWTEGCWC
uniref:Uncharacterized protein n=1 Tax=Anguilla anguilla TaxID=7936 RepID=A0A0E9R7I5_ANGAN